MANLQQLPKINFDKLVDASSGSRPRRCNPNWLGYMPNSISLSQLWIPGTHDAASFTSSTNSNPAIVGGLVDFMARYHCVPPYFKPFRTQSFSLPYQFLAGIRFCDIRLRHAKDNLYLHHGSVFLNETWKGVLHKCVDFLTKYPTECIILKVQQVGPWYLLDMTTNRSGQVNQIPSYNRGENCY